MKNRSPLQKSITPICRQPLPLNSLCQSMESRRTDHHFQDLPIKQTKKPEASAKTVQRKRAFHLFIDPKGKGDYKEQETFHLDVRGHKLKNLRIIAPSVISRTSDSTSLSVLKICMEISHPMHRKERSSNSAMNTCAKTSAGNYSSQKQALSPCQVFISTSPAFTKFN